MNRNEIFTNIPKIISQSSLVTPTTGQCDACSPVVCAQDQGSLSKSPNILHYKPHYVIEQPINPIHSTFLSPFPQTFSVLNKSAITCLQYFNSPKPLESIPPPWAKAWGESTMQSALEQMITLGLLRPGGSTQNTLCTPVEVPKTLAVWLHITGRCNLHCEYCYLLHNNTDMPFEIGREAIEATFWSAIVHNYQEVKFKYAGGEPLLRFSLIKKLHQYAQKLAEQHGLGLDGVVLSNGTLLKNEIVREIQALGLRLMISLDNVPTPHPPSTGSGQASQEGNLHPPSPSRGEFHPPLTPPITGGEYSGCILMGGMRQGMPCRRLIWR